MMNFSKISQILIIGLNMSLFLLFLLLPSINQSEFANSTITSKTLFFIYSLLIIIFLFTLKIILKKHKTVSINISRIDISVSLMFIFIIVNRYFIQSNFGFSIRFIELLGLGFLYIILRSFQIKIFLYFLISIVLSGTIQAIYGNLQLLGYYPSNHSGFKLTGSFFNPGPYSGFLISVFPIALGIYLFKEKITQQLLLNIISKKNLILNNIIKYTIEYIPLLGMVSIILVIPATHSRASWLAVLISGILLLEFRYQIIKTFLRQLNKPKKAILIAVSILIIGVSFLGLYYFKKGSSDGRLFIWRVSTEIIKDNPFFGVGFDQFKAYYMNYQADHFSKYGETEDALVADNSYYAFNEFIQYMVENGIVGFILLISILYIIIKMPIVKGNNHLSVILKVSLLSIGVFAFFSYPMEILPIKIIIVVLLASLATLHQNKIGLLQNFTISTPIKIVLKTSAIGCVLLITFLSLKSINKLNKSFKNWELAQVSYRFGDYESSIQEYEEAYPEFKKNGEFLMNYGKALSMYDQDNKAIQILEQAKTQLNTTITETAIGDAYKNQKQYKDAEISYTHAANMIPTRFYPLYLLVKLYEESNEKEKAIAIANTILNKEVKISSTAIKEIKIEMKNIITKYNQD